MNKLIVCASGGDSSGRTAGQELWKSDISCGWQRILQICQSLGYGRVSDLVVQGGEPDFTQAPRITKCGKPAKRRGQARPPVGGDFVLKKHADDLITWVAELGHDAVINIDVADGLPVSWSADNTRLFFET